MHACEVVNCRDSDYDVYIGRPADLLGVDVDEAETSWECPYVVGPDGTARQVVTQFRAYLRANPVLCARALTELCGKVLGCWCVPCAEDECHGFVYRELLEYGRLSRRPRGI